ncbi:MAG: hypothetical protein ACRELA_04275 [Candidatus Rokuibacteriota bacterium]
MVAQALDALVGNDPSEEAVAAALTTIPAAEVPDVLRRLARAHGPAALPVLRHCLSGRAEWAEAGAAALATLPTPEAAATLAAAEATARTKATRTALRRALYRLRQAGVMPPTPSPSPRPPTPRWALGQAWASAIDGTGSRGVWLVLENPLGERTLLSAILNDGAGVLDFTSRSVGKKRLDEHLRRLRTESPLPVVALPPSWALHLLVEASGPHVHTGTPLPGDLSRWLVALPLPEPPPSPPIHARVDREALADPALRERSAELLTRPELSGWFLEPSALHAEALELLQAKESRLVVSDQIKAERVAALVDHVIDAHFDPAARGRWQRRLEETAWVLVETGRPTEARIAAAAGLALAEPERPARHISFVRALVERSLEVAGEVALGRVSSADASRTPRPTS